MSDMTRGRGLIGKGMRFFLLLLFRLSSFFLLFSLAFGVFFLAHSLSSYLSCDLWRLRAISSCWWWVLFCCCFVVVLLLFFFLFPQLPFVPLVVKKPDGCKISLLYRVTHNGSKKNTFSLGLFLFRGMKKYNVDTICLQKERRMA